MIQSRARAHTYDDLQYDHAFGIRAAVFVKAEALEVLRNPTFTNKDNSCAYDSSGDKNTRILSVIIVNAYNTPKPF